jgi:hypothetical protein
VLENRPGRGAEGTVNLERMKAVVAILEAAGVGPNAYFEMQHDVLYLPWDEPTGPTAEALAAAGCHYEEDVDSWASF